MDRGVTRLSGIPARAGSSNGAPARDRTTAPCLLPQGSRGPAERCAGLLQAQSPGPSSTTIRRRQGRQAPPHAALRRAAPARRPRVRGAAPAQSLASSAMPQKRRGVILFTGAIAGVKPFATSAALTLGLMGPNFFLPLHALSSLFRWMLVYAPLSAHA
jgi:hypothetical protein